MENAGWSWPRFHVANSWSFGSWEDNKEGVLASGKMAILWCSDERELQKSTESWSSLLGHKEHLDLVYLDLVYLVYQSWDLRASMVFSLAVQKEPSLFKGLLQSNYVKLLQTFSIFSTLFLSLRSGLHSPCSDSLTSLLCSLQSWLRVMEASLGWQLVLQEMEGKWMHISWYFWRCCRITVNTPLNNCTGIVHWSQYPGKSICNTWMHIPVSLGLAIMKA